ncbi:unnamed protein product, partial [Prunus brigantina]
LSLSLPASSPSPSNFFAQPVAPRATTATTGHHLGRHRSQKDRREFLLQSHLVSAANHQHSRRNLQKSRRFFQKFKPLVLSQFSTKFVL